ncbi:MAG: LysR family transcriptional regulator [Devosia sp.]|uniref:LysR family transcriptional regulator n=1 Tax=Devosia sp. TaxID=1871048 RepID=UPI0033993691
MDRFQAMTVFAKVAEAGGFSGAARQLNMSPPSVTRVVAALEAALGTRLLHRTTRSLKLTETGARYLEDCRRILAELQQADAAASGSYLAPVGSLTISAPVLFGRMHVMPILTAFLERHPKVVGRALFVDRMTNLVEEGIDVAIRIGHLADASYPATRVGSMRQVICGTPTYLRQHGILRDPTDLTKHRLIGTTAAWSALEWRLGQKGELPIRVEPTLFSNTNDAAIAAALSGFGLTRVPFYQVAADIGSGALLTVLDEYEAEPLPIHVVHAERQHAPAKVRQFVDLAVARLRADKSIGGS